MSMLKQIKESSGTEIIESICEGCSAYESGPKKHKTALSFCVECQEKLCEGCVEAHATVRATRTHVIVQLGNVRSRNIGSTVSSLASCEKHPSYSRELFCFDCKLAICKLCFTGVHSSHRCSDVNVVTKDFRHRLTVDSTKMTDSVKRCNEILEYVLKEKNKFTAQISDVESEIDKQSEQLKQLIDQQRDKLLLEVQSSKSSRIKQVDNVTAKIEEQMSLASSLIKYSEELRDKGAASEIARQSSSLHDRAGELLKLDVIQRAVNELGSIDVKFTAAKTSANLVGNIQVKHTAGSTSFVDTTQYAECSSTSANRPTGSTDATLYAECSSNLMASHRSTVTKFYSPTLTHVIPAGDQVNGVTSVKNQLFVLRRLSRQQIEVYDTETFTVQRPIRVDGLKDSIFNECRLASCATNNCLYVGDRVNTAIYRVELRSGRNVSKWRVGSEPVGLSVNNACNVLVTFGEASKIQEYTTRGSLVREICLKSDVTSPRYAAQLSGGQFVVSHWKPVHGVSRVDTDGRVIAGFRNKPDSQTKLLNSPEQLAVDKNNFILVADSNSNRIVLLHPSLSKSRDLPLAVDGGLNQPWIVHLDESRGRLYVGELRGGRVLVFDNGFNIAKLI